MEMRLNKMPMRPIPEGHPGANPENPNIDPDFVRKGTDPNAITPGHIAIRRLEEGALSGVEQAFWTHPDTELDGWMSRGGAGI